MKKNISETKQLETNFSFATGQPTLAVKVEAAVVMEKLTAETAVATATVETEVVTVETVTMMVEMQTPMAKMVETEIPMVETLTAETEMAMAMETEMATEMENGWTTAAQLTSQWNNSCLDRNVASSISASTEKKQKENVLLALISILLDR